jgi:hypothetical protein
MTVDRCLKSSDGNHIYEMTDDGESVIYVCVYCDNVKRFNAMTKEWK